MSEKESDLQKKHRQQLDHDGMGDFTRFHSSTPRDDKSLENKIKQLFRKFFSN